jgi:hypothetical protein
MPRDNESLIDIERAVRRILRYTDQRAIAFTVQCRNRWYLERAIAIEAVGYAIASCWAFKSTTPTGDPLYRAMQK